MNEQTLQFIVAIISVAGAVLSLIFGVSLHRKMAVQIAAWFLILIGIVVVVGYIADAPTVYTFPPDRTSMALPTGICFAIVGGCLLVLVNEVNFKSRKKP